MLRTKSHVQHGHTSVYEHSVAVTVECLRIADQFDIAVDRRSLIRGALLHDYFLYDWHSRPKEHRPHGFTHAKTALGNAERDFQINPIEAEMIRCHMFPMNILRVPHHRESIILCLADKTVASKETLNGGIAAIKRVGSGIRRS
ncbi:MAG: HD domain-containing protein [Oscillospiraceae bacterium]|nr:HD domain-containing protein [Oscillospiraceae bacterium]